MTKNMKSFKKYIKEAGVPSEVKTIKKEYGKEFNKILNLVTKEAEKRKINQYTHSATFNSLDFSRKELTIRFSKKYLGDDNFNITVKLSKEQFDFLSISQKQFKLYVTYYYF